MATQVKTGLIANNAITDAKIANVALTGVTASSGDSSTSLATTAFVVGEINSLIDSAPGALNTLNELAAAMGDDANFSTTVTNSIATKLPLAGGTLTGDLVLKSDGGSDVINVVHSGNTVQLVSIGQSSDNSGNGVIQLKRNNGVLHSQIHSHGSTYFNGGNVGIGFASGTPDELLHLQKGSGTTIVKTEVAANSIVGFEIQKTGSTTSNWRIVDGQTVNGNLEIYDVTDSRSVMMIDGDGDIGMGVTPATHAKLTLGGTATSYSSVLAFDNSTTGGATFFMLASDNTWSAGGNNFFMGHGTPSSAAVDLTIDADGKVGIGSTSPGSELHVKGTDETQVWIDSATNTNPGIRLLENGSNKWTIGNDNTNDGLFFYDFGSTSEKMRIKAGNGHVGIGTDNPRYNLTVNGNNSTAIGIGVDNASGSSTLDIAALGSGYGSHQAGAGEVWFYSPDNINIGGATGNTNNIKFIANNNLNMVINGDGSGIGMKQKVIIERSVNGSGSVSYEEILKISRIGGSSSNNQREAAISFFDSANSTYTAMITGVRTSPAGNYDGGLSIYTNSHSQNANATSISELVSGRVVHFSAEQASTFYGDVYVDGANHRISQNGATREAKGGYINGNQTVSYTINHTNQSVFHIRCGFNHYGLMSYGCALDQVYANGSGGITSTTAALNHTTGAGGSWSVSRVDTDNVTITKNAGTYAGGGYYYIIVEGANL